LWLPPKVWFQGSQSTRTGGSSASVTKHWRIICWFAHSMRCVLMTPLGSFVDPEVNRNLAIVSGPTRAWAPSTAGVGAVAASASNAIVSRPCSAPVARTIGVSRGTTASIALPYAGPLANTSPGVSMPKM
jgi:hypothetical protein